MKIKIDDSRIIYLVTLLFKTTHNPNIQIFQKMQKLSGNPQNAMQETILEAEKKHGSIDLLSSTILNLSPSIFLDESINNLKKI